MNTERKNPFLKKNNIRVALLISDINKAKEISEIFRVIDVIPEYYENLRDFWKATLANRPSFSIIDVKLMTEAELMFRDHPHVKSGKLQTAYYYTDASKPLLFSTFELENLGYINGSMPLRGQLKATLKRFNKMNDLISENEFLTTRYEQAEKQIDQLVNNVEKNKIESFYQNKFNDLRNALDASKIHADFFTAVSSVFDNWSDIKSYTFMELSFNGQKLIAPKLASKKYREIPSLWLGKTCQNGIEFFAQNLASQVVLDVMGGDIMSLLIRSTGDNPERIMFVEVKDEDMLNRFKWEELERTLSSLYQYFSLRNEVPVNARDNVLQPWELLSVLDDYLFGKNSNSFTAKEKLALLDLDFTKIIQTSQKNNGMRFYWGKFFNDFFSKLERQKKISFKVSSIGISHVALMVDQEGLDETFAAVKSFVKSFSYWRYFEDMDLVVASDLTPSVKMIPLSSKAYFNYLGEGPEQKILSENTQRRPKKNDAVKVWREAPTQSM